MNSREAGNSLIEVMIGVVFLAVAMSSLGLGVLSGVRSSADIRDGNVIQNQAFTFMERIQHLRFGTEDDLAASPASLDQLFNDTLGLPNLSLCQLRKPVAEDGMTFRITEFEKNGTWEVRVNRDFDGDRILDVEEDVGDLLKVEILFKGKPVLTTYRARPAVAQ